MIFAAAMLPLALLVLGLSAFALRSDAPEPRTSQTNREEHH